MIANGGEAYVSPEARQVLLEKRVQVGGTNSSGGFTVPTELATFIVESMKAFGPMYTSNLFTTINTASGNTFNIPTVDDTAVTAEAHTEGTAPTDDAGKDVTFGQKTLGAFAFNTEFIRWSAELNVDSVLNMESLLGRLLGERMARIANSKLTTGSGSSDVEGIVTNAGAGITAASATAITSDELIDLVHSVDPAYRNSPNTAIMMNDSTLKAVRKLKDSQNRYLWEIGGYAADMPQTILGYPVVVNQDMASIATGNKSVLFGDMSSFYIRKVGDPAIFIARERFLPDNGILGYIRFDACLTDTAAVKVLAQA
jgi:HK97 family phage major capsid protein